MDLKIALGQIACHVGDFEGNHDKIIQAALSTSADLLILPELCVCGYPPEDLLAYDQFIAVCQQSVDRLIQTLADQAPKDLYVTLGYPEAHQGKLFNVMHVICNGKSVAKHRKNHLPNYGVFDEKRYFSAGCEPAVFNLKDQRVALGICHDLWNEQFHNQIVDLHPQLVVIANASPFYLGVQQDRENLTTALSVEAGCDIVYVNRVGGQDEHVFDGGSHYVSNAQVKYRLPMFTEQVAMTSEAMLAKIPTEIELIYRALVAGVKDYVAASKCKIVFVGLSGGIDSAVVLCIVAEALKVQNVRAVLMPSRYTSQMSNDDAKKLADNLSIEYLIVDIQPSVDTTIASLCDTMKRGIADIAMENLQSRMRGLLLMSLANDAQGLVLTTSNKSELATGYSTLYGDTAGAFDVLKDVSKSRVYELAEFINQNKEIIPERIISRPPTAELREAQLDSDTLPSYDHIDGMLEAIVENLQSPRLASAKFGLSDTLTFTKLLTINEFKRRQAPIGPTLTKRAFGKNWRMPVANYFSFSHSLEDDC